MSFESHLGDHVIAIDTTKTGGGNDTGFNPKALLLSALAGCTGMDIVSILKKMRVAFTNFEIEAEAEQTNDEPRVFVDFNLTYKISTDPGNEEKVQKAIELSMDKYCVVSAMLKKHAPINTKLVITP